jgi:hypothetical protein
MKKVVEVDAAGEIRLTPDVIGHAAPQERFEVEQVGDRVVLVRMNGNGDKPFWETATPRERAEAFLAWARQKRPPTPPLSDKAISRDSIYD